jgi:hypothetical protein
MIGRPRLWAIALAIVGVVLTQPVPAGATSLFMATIDGAQMDPPTNSFCKGTGTFVLSDDELSLSYNIHFDPWVRDEFISHIHEQNPPDNPGQFILTEIAAGPDKVGEIKLGAVDVIALREGRLFVQVHTVRYQLGEVRGYILPGTPAFGATWGKLKALYR